MRWTGLIPLLAMVALAEPAGATRPNKACNLSERDFIGNWQSRISSGISPYDSMEVQFAIEDGRRIFRSWLHQRPDLNGTWSFGDCRIRVRGPGDLETTYRLVGHHKSRLIEDDGGPAFRRMR